MIVTLIGKARCLGTRERFKVTKQSNQEECHGVRSTCRETPHLGSLHCLFQRPEEHVKQ